MAKSFGLQIAALLVYVTIGRYSKWDRIIAPVLKC